MRKQLMLLVAAAASVACVAADEDENPARLLGNAAKNLAQMPVSAVRPRSGRENNLPSVEVPAWSDLAVSRLRAEAVGVASSLWQDVLLSPHALAIAEAKEGGAARQVLGAIAEALQSDVFAVSQQVAHSGVISAVKSVSAKNNDKWKETTEIFQKVLGKVNLLYGYLDGYMNDQKSVAHNALEDYARSIVEPGSSQDTSLGVALLQLHNITVGGRDSILALLGQVIDARKDGSTQSHLCDLGQSPHQLVYNLYTAIALAEVKGYAMMQFSYMMLRLYGRGNFTLESDLARKTFETQAGEKLMAAKAVLEGLSRDYSRCDPPTHVEGKTHIQLTQLLQGIIENEVDLNNLSSCKEKCSSYTVAQTHQCFKDLLCAKQRRCDGGRLYDCTFYDADAWVCLGDAADKSSSKGRRYNWIEYEDGTILGNKDQCVNKIKVDSWWRYLFWHCSYCLCKCDAPGPHSDRYWSLRPAVADVDRNMVVTGARFVKKNRVVHLEIEQAEALPEGGVKEETRAWKEAPVVNVETDKVNEDFMMMSYEQRAFDTDRLEAPPGHVVTGIKLRNLGGHLNMEIQVTPIKFSDGRLVTDRSTWVANDNTPATAEARTQVDILLPDIPTEFRAPNEIDTAHNQFVMFDATSAEKDVMQTTIPFIDAQPVATTTGTWLSGVSTYHRGRIGSGGFVAIAVKTFDFSTHLLPADSNNRTRMKEQLRYEFKRDVDSRSNIE